MGRILKLLRPRDSSRSPTLAVKSNKELLKPISPNLQAAALIRDLRILTEVTPRRLLVRLVQAQPRNQCEIHAIAEILQEV